SRDVRGGLDPPGCRPLRLREEFARVLPELRPPRGRSALDPGQGDGPRVTKIGAAVAAVSLIALTGCGSGDSNSTPAPSPSGAGCSAGTPIGGTPALTTQLIA